MIYIEGEYVAANAIARVVKHPADEAVCVILKCGKELRVRVHPPETKNQVIADVVKRIDAEMHKL